MKKKKVSIAKAAEMYDRVMLCAAKELQADLGTAYALYKNRSTEAWEVYCKICAAIGSKPSNRNFMDSRLYP